MARSEIPVDLTNPGQVFACLGFMEAAEILQGGTVAGFACEDQVVDARFHLETAGEEPPVHRVLRFLSEAAVTSLAPEGSAHRTEKWKVPTEVVSAGETSFPSANPDSPAVLPARLSDNAGAEITLSHWTDGSQRDNVKFWAGSGGYPGVALLRDALDLVRAGPTQQEADPFAFATRQSSSFRFDWRRDYIPLDAGFSPNDHSNVVMSGYPFVEILAAIGLSHAWPARLERLRYRYGVLGGGALLEPVFVRAALGDISPVPDLPFRRYEMRLGWPGQEGQARCITDVTEVTDPHAIEETA